MISLPSPIPHSPFPSFCTHKVNLLNEYKQQREPQGIEYPQTKPTTIHLHAQKVSSLEDSSYWVVAQILTVGQSVAFLLSLPAVKWTHR